MQVAFNGRMYDRCAIYGSCSGLQHNCSTLILPTFYKNKMIFTDTEHNIIPCPYPSHLRLKIQFPPVISLCMP